MVENENVFSVDGQSSWLDQLDNNINSLLRDLKWSKDAVLKNPYLTKCSHNTHHFVHTDHLGRHENVCRLVTLGRDKAEVLQMPDTISRECYNQNSSSKEDVEALQNIIQERMERSAVVEEQEADVPLSEQELLAVMRDVKRRRQAYRRVHTARKTYTEILHEVIASQMEYLEELNSAIATAQKDGDPCIPQKDNFEKKKPRKRHLQE